MNQSKYLINGAVAAAVALYLAGCGSGGGRSVIPSQQSSQHGVSPKPMQTHAHAQIAQTHVLTWQDDTGLKNPSFTWDQIAPYVDWSVVATQDNAAAQAAGIKTVMYSDPNRVYKGMPEYSHDETTFAHDCSNNRITIKGTRLKTFLTQPSSSVLESLWQQHLADYNQGGHADYNAVFDDTPLIRRVSALPCNYSQPAWLAMENFMNTRLDYPIVFNGLGHLANGPDQVSPAIALLNTSIGGMMEGCYSNYAGYPEPTLQVWHTFEDTEILVLATAGKSFVCRGFDDTPDTLAHHQRLYMYGSFLLTYDPARAVFSPKFKPASNGFWIQPEQQLVALDPVIVAPTIIDQLSVGTNVYGRQHNNCYYAGNWIGACASIVNSDKPAFAHPMPWPGVYQHTLVLSGGDILDGGTASTNGPAPRANIKGSSAIIVIQ